MTRWKDRTCTPSPQLEPISISSNWTRTITVKMVAKTLYKKEVNIKIKIGERILIHIHPPYLRGYVVRIGEHSGNVKDHRLVEQLDEEQFSLQREYKTVSHYLYLH